MDVVVFECERCSRRDFVRRSGCPGCGATEPREVSIEGTGTVYASTRIRVAPGSFSSETPYWIVLADLGGVRVVGRLSGSSPDPAIGDRVTVTRAGEHLELEVGG